MRAPAAAGVTAVALFGFLAIGVVLPVLPRYVQGPVGGGDVAAGVVYGIFALTALLSRPVAGFLADRRGGGSVLATGLVVATIAGALLFVPFGLPTLILARLTVGAAEGLIAIGGTMLAIELAPEHARGRAIGVFGLAFWIGLSLGALIGEALFRAGGYEAVWAFATVAPVAGVVGARRLPRPPLPAAALPPANGILRGLIPPRPAVVPGVLLALGGYGYAAVTGFVVLHLDAEGVAGGAIALTAFAGTSVLARLAAGGLPDRLGGRRAAIAALGVQSVGVLIIGMASSLAAALAGAALAGFGTALLFPSLSLIVLERVEPARRAAAIGGFAAFLDVGVAVSGPACGAIAATAGWPSAFWVASGLSLAGCAALALGRRFAEPTLGWSGRRLGAARSPGS